MALQPSKSDAAVVDMEHEAILFPLMPSPFVPLCYMTNYITGQANRFDRSQKPPKQKESYKAKWSQPQAQPGSPQAGQSADYDTQLQKPVLQGRAKEIKEQPRYAPSLGTMHPCLGLGASMTHICLFCVAVATLLHSQIVLMYCLQVLCT